VVASAAARQILVFQCHWHILAPWSPQCNTGCHNYRSPCCLFQCGWVDHGQPIATTTKVGSLAPSGECGRYMCSQFVQKRASAAGCGFPQWWPCVQIGTSWPLLLTQAKEATPATRSTGRVYPGLAMNQCFVCKEGKHGLASICV